MHTPGPWTILSDSDIMAAIGTGDPSPPICAVYYRNARKADARLIAAAPELLEALRACDKLLDGVACTDYPVQDELAMVKKAIRRATQL